jgi:hypothetical protein
LSPDLVCVELAGELRDILQTIRVAGGNKWSGLPDVVAIFPDGRVVMREMKLAGKDKLRETQHALRDWPVAYFQIGFVLKSSSG